MNDEKPADVSAPAPAASSDSVKTCPKCGQVSSGSALSGLCEGCLMRVGLGIGSSPDHGAENQDIRSLFDNLDTEDQGLPREFGEYELLEEIAIGGMGVIYKAKHLGLGRIVALKMIKAGELARREDVRRFKGEAEAAARLRHPNIVTIHDIGEEEGLPYFSMSYVGGPNLGQLVRQQPLSARRAATLLKKIAMAVQHAHDEGLLHRDLKPGNILIDVSDEPQVTDFGLARAIHSDSSLTRSGAILGSPSYMSPEQAEGRTKDINVRTDVYALGAVLYEMVTGRPPFQGESAMHTMRLVCNAAPAAPRLLNPDVPKDLETVCLRCLEKSPARRYATAREVADEMEAFLAGRPIKARPVGPAGRVLRWCRRQPALAALSAALILALVGGVIGMAMGWEEARRKAVDEQLARHAAERGEYRASLGVYDSDMTLANLAALEQNHARLLELLDRHDPALHPDIRDFRSWEWFYLKRQTVGDELFVLGLHEKPLAAVAVSPDGKWAASADRGGQLFIWDMEKRATACRFDAGSRNEATISFSPDGNWMAAAWNLGHTSLWRTGRWQEPVKVWKRSSSGCLVFSRDSRYLYQSSRDNLKRFPMPQDDEPPPAEEQVFNMPSNWWVLPAYEPESRDVIVFRGGLNVWDGDIEDFKTTEWKMEIDDGFATMLEREPGGNRLAGWFNDENVYVFDAKTLQPVHLLKGHRGAVFDVDYSKDGKLLATGGADQSVQIWNLETGTRVRRLSGHRGTVRAVSFFPDATQVLSGSDDGTVRAWAATAAPLPEGRIKRSGRLASLAHDGSVFLGDTGDWKEMLVWSVATGNVVASLDCTAFRDAVSGPGGDMLAILHTDGRLEVREREDQDYVTKRGLETPATAVTDGIALSRDAKSLILIMGDHGVIYDTATLQQTARLTWPKERGSVLGVASSAGSGLFAAAHSSGEITVWIMKTGQEVSVVEGSRSFHPGLAFSPDGKLLACAAFDGGARVWDLSVSPPQVILTTTAHEPSWSVAFTPDGRRLVAGLDSGDLSFWDLQTKSLVMQFRNQGVPAVRMIFDPKDHALITMSANRVIRRPVAPGFMIRKQN